MFPQYENLSVEEMLHKQIELKQKLAQAVSSGMSSQVVEQLQSMLEFLNTEIRVKSELEKLQEQRKLAEEEGTDPNGDGTSLSIGD